jgi:hypothetical protein
MSRPSRSTWPAETGTSPAQAFTSVDLPAPFGPRSATISPGMTASEARRRIGRPGS